MLNKILLCILLGVVSIKYLFAQTDTTNTEEQSKVITIVETSDINGAFLPYNYIDQQINDKKLSMLQLSSAIAKIKAENPNTIILDSGNSLFSDFNKILQFENKEDPIIIAQKYIGYDSIALGANDLRYGLPYLEKLQAMEQAQITLANVYNSKEERIFEPYKVIEKGGIKVAIIGLLDIDPNMYKIDSNQYRIAPIVPELQEILDKLSGENAVDFVIVTLNLPGNNPQKERERLRELTKDIIGISLILIPDFPFINDLVNGVQVISSGGKSLGISKTQVTFVKEGEKWIYKTAKLGRGSTQVNISTSTVIVNEKDLDKKLQTILDPSKEIINHNILAKIEGELLPIDIKGIDNSKLKSTSLTTFLNEMQKYYTQAELSSVTVYCEADFLVNNKVITRQDVKKIYSDDISYLRAYQISGKQLRQYLEWIASYYNQRKEGDITISFNPERDGMFDVLSGVIYEINITKPSGSRVDNLARVDGSKIKDTDVFVIAMSNKRAKMLVDTAVFGKEPFKLIFDLEPVMKEDAKIQRLIVQYLKKVKQGVLKVPNPEDNWDILNMPIATEDLITLRRLINTAKLLIPASADGTIKNVRSITKDDLLEAEAKK